MLDAHEYTVGWICAITVEYVAAKSFLEETYAIPEYVSANDNNNYTLGKIGQHNVVIAVLPDKGYGLVNAATVTTDLLHSFPNVRIGLMVGVGGGAPSPDNDIRLGDVAVSSSVFHFEPRKMIQEEAPELWGPLDRPPMVLRTAMNGLQARYTLEGHTIDSDIDEVLERYPHMKPVFQRPALDSDRLFQSGITHRSSCEDDSSCCTDSAKLVQRRDRNDRLDNPGIYYGVVATSNMVMKDAIKRDDLATKRGVICFEMEAAGLISLFPCLIIRGICDYSDSHKNKAWQGYAAMTAAAYAKDLLKLIPLNRVEAERRMTDILAEVPESMARAEANVQVIRSKVESDEDREILEWLSPEDYNLQQNDCISTREPETGQWVFDAPEFRQWIEGEGQTLFCPGIPGAGKTIITSTVIDHLQRRFGEDTGIGLAYVYMNYKRHAAQKLDDLLASLLRQLSGTISPLPENVRELYDSKRAVKRPSTKALQQGIFGLAGAYSRSFIVIDALDECQAADGCRDEFISAILALQAHANVNIFATSRPIPAIVEQFRGNTVLEIRARSEDIQMYIDRRIEKSGKPILRTHSKVIKDEIIKVVEGMFLLAQLHFDTISTRRTLRQIKDTLRTLPNGPKAYDQAYDEAMRRISGSDPVSAEIAMKVLLWITCAKRPLTIVEMQHALAVVIGDHHLDEENILEIDDMVSTCTGLVAINEESNIVRLVHYTTQEYLVRTQGIWFPNAEAIITEHCLAYLHFDDFETGVSCTDEEFDARLLLHPLYDYAAHNWGHHALDADRAGEEVILALLANEAKRSAASQVCMATRGARGYSQRIPCGLSALHLAAYFGLAHISATLLRCGSEPDAKDTYQRTPLSLAAANGHSLVVSLLLATGKVDVNNKDKDGRTPVSWAAAHGHKEIVRQLMGEANVDVSSIDDHQQAPSDWANANGHDDIVELITAGAQYDNLRPARMESKKASDLLIRAVKKGNEAAVRILIADIDINVQDPLGRTALSWASRKGNANLVRLILASGKVDLNTRDADGYSALDMAVVHGHGEIIKLLLEQDGVDLNEGQTTPLHLAVRAGNHAVAASLLHHGARPDAKDPFGRSPLWYAALNGEEAIVRSLLEVASTPINIPDENGIMPIECAASGGHLSIMNILLENCPQHNLPHYDRSELDYAREMIMILPSDTCVRDMTAEESLGLLLKAAGRGHIDFVRCLLRKGIDTSLVNTVFINSGPELLLVFLLDVHRGSRRSDRERPDCDLLFLWAMKNGFTSVADFILSEGLPIFSYIPYAPALMCWVALNGYLPAVKLLVTQGANVNGDMGPLFLSYEEKSHTSATRQPPTSEQEGELRKRRTDSWSLVELSPTSGSECYMERASDSSKDPEQGDSPPLPRHFSQIFEQSLVCPLSSNMRAPLYWAASNGHTHVMRFLLEKGASVEAEDFGGETALSMAVQNGRYDSVQLLLEEGGDVNETVFTHKLRNRTLLGQAAGKGDEKMVYLLLCNDADIEREDSDFWTPLLLAVHGNHIKTARRLLQAGAKVEGHGSTLRVNTPLSLAASNGHTEMVQLLLQYGANINWPGRAEFTPLMSAAHAGEADMVRLLLQEGADLTHKYVDRDLHGPIIVTALSLAVQKHDHVIDVLLLDSPDEDARNDRATAMLFDAITYENINLVSRLLENGADIGFQRPIYHGYTPLHYAISRRSTVMAAVLLDSGADIESRSDEDDEDDCGSTPLLLAVSKDWTNGVEFLLTRCADLTTTDDKGMGALHFAVCLESPSMINFLLEQGADIEAKTAPGVSDELTPLLLAIQLQWFWGVEYLVGKRADVNAADYVGSSALHHAASRRLRDVIVLLVEEGADLDRRDADGRTTRQIIQELAREDPSFDSLLAYTEVSAAPMVTRFVGSANRVEDSAREIMIDGGLF